MSSYFEILVNDQLFSGWEQASVVTDMESLSSTFSFQANDKDNILTAINAGVPCKIYAVVDRQKTLVLDGYIDERQRTLDAGSHTLVVGGSDKLIDLIDCSVIRDNRSWVKKQFSKIIADLVSPFGYTVDTTQLISDPIVEKLTLQTGESAFDAIERLCRSQAVLPLSNYAAELVLTYSADSTRANDALVEGFNIKQINDTNTWTDRFSQYTCLAQSAGNGRAWSKELLQSKGYAEDTTVSRYRPLLFVAESRLTKEEMQSRVNWEAQIRAGRSASQTVLVKGWTQSNGELWTKNTRTVLKVPTWEIDAEKLITGVTFSWDASGSQTLLTLQHPDVYRANPTETIEL